MFHRGEKSKSLLGGITVFTGSIKLRFFYFELITLNKINSKKYKPSFSFRWYCSTYLLNSGCMIPISLSTLFVSSLLCPVLSYLIIFNYPCWTRLSLTFFVTPFCIVKSLFIYNHGNCNYFDIKLLTYTL